jgi:nitrite reductase/ring-hydroxylating ferredoxin subunit/DMSO/TMAO reductase YedYZ heme-binding membrane subunit
MSVGYVPIQWNRHKKTYDTVVAGGVIVYLLSFVLAGRWWYQEPRALSDEILILRALGSCAFLMLTVILCIGPLARLDRRFLPLLYNRRHLGVATFAVALSHGALAIGFYHGFGVVNPLISLLTSNTNFTSLRAFPFQILGAAALLILFLMASTSHDFWNRNLGPRVWKAIHMSVYAAYGLVVMHVTLGAIQTQRGIGLAVAVGCAVTAVSALHLVAGLREWIADRSGRPLAVEDATGWIDAGLADEIPELRGITVCGPGSERIAVFRYQGRISALTNVCAHQGGPLGEGKIIDGCVTCPWHGWQYRPGDGQAPPPFTERIATHRVRVVGRRVFVHPEPLPPGTPVEPARLKD